MSFVAKPDRCPQKPYLAVLLQYDTEAHRVSDKRRESQDRVVPPWHLLSWNCKLIQGEYFIVLCAKQITQEKNMLGFVVSGHSIFLNLLDQKGLQSTITPALAQQILDGVPSDHHCRCSWVYVDGSRSFSLLHIYNPVLFTNVTFVSPNIWFNS